jgi:hypothetical protein
MCAVSTTRVIGQIVSETMLHYDTNFLNLVQLHKASNAFFFQQDTVTVHTLKNSVCCLQNVLGKRIISGGF